MKYIADRITVDPDLCNGRPTIRGKRIAVESILDYLSSGESYEEILIHFPSLEKEDILACLKFAAEIMHRFTVKSTAA